MIFLTEYRLKIIRSPDIVVGRLRYYRDSSPIFFFYLVHNRQLPYVLAERNSTKTAHMLESECNLKMHVQNLGYPLSLKIGSPKTTFLMTSQLNSKFSGLYLPKET